MTASSSGLGVSRYGLLSLAGIVLAWLVGFAARWIALMLHREAVAFPVLRPAVAALVGLAALLAVLGLWRDAKRGPALIAAGILLVQGLVMWAASRAFAG